MSDYAGVDSPFYNRKDIKSVVIEPGVTNVGNQAFLHCDNLASANISKNTEKIGYYAFAYTKIENITIPYSTSEIGSFAFEGCTSLKKVYICGGREKTINDYAFNGCTALSSLELGSTVSAIGSYAFYGCTSLKTVKIPDSVNGIYQRAFEGCTSLTDVVIGNKVKTIGTGAFIYCKKLKNVAFGVSVESIGDNAFDSCKSLDKVVLMPSTKHIGNGAFGGCSSVTYAFLPGVETVSPKAFMYCSKLGEVYFANGKIRAIGEEAFLNCPELKKIGLPDSAAELVKYSIGYNKENNKYVKNSSINICGSPKSEAEKYAKANGLTFQSTASHTHKLQTETVPSTCTQKGYKITLCKYCGKTTKNNYTAANGHKWAEWATIGYDLSKNTSTQTRKCTVCGESSSRTIKNAITRLAGANRYETASVISSKMYKTANTVIVATGLTFHDAMVAVPLAKAYNAPLLLATDKHITDQTKAELKRLKAKNVIVVSTNGAIGAKAKAEFKAAKYNMTYIEGKTCFETAAKVAKALQTKTKKAPTTIFFATNGAFADALSASPVAAIKGAPILYLKNKGSIDTATANYLKSVKGKVKNVYIIGGDGVISNAMMNKVAIALGLTINKNVVRVAGKNRYETCTAVNNKFNSVLTGDGICVAKGLDFPDALAGGVYAASTKQALFLADGKKLQDCQNSYLKTKNVAKITVFGGIGAVPDDLVKLIAKTSV